MLNSVPASLRQTLIAAAPPETLFPALMSALGDFLQCDRCFLYLRHPQTRLGRVPFCWVRHSAIPTVYDPDWKPEPESLPDEDPMFAAALATQPSIFIEDVEAASPEVLNTQFERENFGHRALIHAHLCHAGDLWGVLQPCVFDRPRIWTAAERQVMEEVVQAITPISVSYVQQEQCCSQ